MESSEGHPREIPIEQIIAAVGAERLLSSPGTLNLIHGTRSPETGETILKTGLKYMEEPRDTTDSYSGPTPPSYFLRNNLSSGNNCLVVVGLPVFPEVINIIRRKLGAEVDPHIFYSPLFGVRTGKDIFKREYYRFPPKFVRGYYDVQKGQWIDNPLYWENALRWPWQKLTETKKIRKDIFNKLNDPDTFVTPGGLHFREPKPSSPLSP